MTHKCCETEVSYSYLSFIAVDEDVVTLDISVDNWMGLQIMQVVNSLENLFTPRFDNLQSWNLDLLHKPVFTLLDSISLQFKPFERSSCHHFSDKHNLFPLTVYPGADEMDNIGMLQLFQQCNLVRDPLPLLFSNFI